MIQNTIAICTWNRAALLHRTLSRFAEIGSTIPDPWELIVVNNNCTDETDAVIQSFTGRLPIRRVFEPTPGVSFARNAAVAAARGDYIFWTDDDVIVNEQWIPALLDAIRVSNADWVFGRSEPIWEAGVPKWYSHEFDGYFALLNYGSEPFSVRDAFHPFYGLNLGSRRDALVRIGPFRTDFGPRENGGGVGEDIDMFNRALAEDMRITYTPHAVVNHIIPAARSVKSVQRHKAWVGCEAYVEWLNETSPCVPRIGGVPRYLYRLAIDDAVGYARSVVRRDVSARFYHELRLLRFLGMIYAAQQILRRSGVASPSALKASADVKPDS